MNAKQVRVEMTALPLQPGSASILVMNAFCISTLSLHGSAPLFQDRLLIAEVRIYRNYLLPVTVLISAILACLLTLVLASSASLAANAILVLSSTGTDHRLLVSL